MTSRTYSPEEKAAVLAALLSGQSVNSVAKEYAIPKGTVHGWKKKLEGVAKITTQKKDQLGEKLTVLVDTNIDTAIKIMQTVGDPSYIKGQPASDVAVLWGVINDKTFKMLEAFGRSDDRDTDPDDLDGAI